MLGNVDFAKIPSFESYKFELKIKNFKILRGGSKINTITNTKIVMISTSSPDKPAHLAKKGYRYIYLIT
jgi:hypothetical protein